MTAFRLPISCPTCASDVSLVNSTSTGLLSIAIVECSSCEREFEITVRLTPHGQNRTAVERAKQSKLRTKRRAMVPA